MRILNKKYWPIQLKLVEVGLPDKRVEWCRLHLGKGCWAAFTNYGWTTFAFNEPADALVFKLTWQK